MMKIWILCGRIFFWLTWPALKLRLAFSTRVRGVIVYNNKILVVKSWIGNKKWTLPGGGIEKGEDSLRALLREIKEEVGLTLKANLCKNQGVFVYNSTNLKYVYTLYSIKLSKKPKLFQNKYEIVELAWINKNKLNKANSNSDVLTAINKLK